jgi:IS5 family transposase
LGNPLPSSPAKAGDPVITSGPKRHNECQIANARDYWIIRFREGFAEVAIDDSVYGEIIGGFAMSERVVGQMSFADRLVSDVARANTTLERIDGLVEWGRVRQLLNGLRSGPMGAPGYPSLALFKALLLQQWYGLSDPQLEEALADRLSFRRFAGLSLVEPIPDHSTLWRFRETLGKSGLAERAFAEITAQIEACGFVLKRGTLIDASLVASAVNPPPVPSQPLPLPPDGRPASKLVRSPLDPDATWTRQEKRRVFGYKAHLAMDQGSRIIRRAVLTGANINESTVADALICGDEATVYGDKGYTNKARRARLKSLGIRDAIMHRADRWHALTRSMVRRNNIISHYRAPIEPLFALLKNVYRFARARYRGLARNQTALQLAATAMNLQRWARCVPAS